ncbi:hypothetical protein ScPMuIL_016216 [Solemya velum]
MDTDKINVSTTNVERTKRTDILIFGYIRGGTTFSGRIFGFRHNAFYFYEPLINNTRFGWIGKKEWCSSTRPHCREPSKVREQSDTAIDILTNIYRCNLTGLGPSTIVKRVHVRRGGPSWEKYEVCLKKGKPTCVQDLSTMCLASQSLVTKVLRLSFDMVEELLLRIPTLKVVHIIRDPRPVVLSRYKMWRRPFQNSSAVAHSLCRKMSLDILISESLKMKFPGRIIILPYENLAEHPFEATKGLFQSLQIPFTELDAQMVDYLTNADADAVWKGSRGNSTQAASRWIDKISEKVLASINKACSPVFGLMSKYVSYSVS